MRKKLKPNQDLDSVQADLIETVCYNYKNGVSVRALAKQFEISPMKTRKILITGGVYTTDLSTEIGELYKDGKNTAEIAAILNTTTANVNSYLPYERIIYNMEERSVEADRQARYRERLKANDSDGAASLDNSDREGNEMPGIRDDIKLELRRTRYKTMIFVIGKKLRRLLPDGVFDNTSDPLARDRSFIWGSNLDGDMVFHEPADPDKSIWCAEVTTAGRGKNKKQGVVLMSANCGFAVIAPLPEVPAIRNMSDEERAEMEWQERREVEKQNKALLREYREQLRDTFISAIREGMLKFCLPENRVLDYTDTVARVEFIKGKKTTPGIRLAEFIDRCLDWKSGDDPVARYNIRSNWTDRKFGYGDYRHVDAAVRKMLEMDSDESRQWLDAFMEAMRERMTARS